MIMSTLEVRNLTKHLGGNLVVDDVSFRVEKGEFFVLLGASGSGKSTLLRLISGLESPDAGQIWIDGEDKTQATPRDRNIGMVFQDYGLYPNMNVYENIAYGLKARGAADWIIKERVPAAAEVLGIAQHLDRSIVDLSGGEQQRVALARALVKDADLYLYDEPLSNLDPKLRYRARRDIMDMHRSKNMPSLYVTHDQTEAYSMGDRIAVMAHGRIQQIGTADELLLEPANAYVARFIGSPPMNLLRGQIQRQEGKAYLQAADLALELPRLAAQRLDGYTGQELLVGFRPNAVVLAETPDAYELEKPQWLEAEVVDVEALIGEVIFILRLGEHTITGVCADDYLERLQEGESVRFAIDPDQLRLFDAQTEKALGRG